MYGLSLSDVSSRIGRVEGGTAGDGGFVLGNNISEFHACRVTYRNIMLRKEMPKAKEKNISEYLSILLMVSDTPTNSLLINMGTGIFKHDDSASGVATRIDYMTPPFFIISMCYAHKCGIKVW